MTDPQRLLQAVTLKRIETLKIYLEELQKRPCWHSVAAITITAARTPQGSDDYVVVCCSDCLTQTVVPRQTII